MVTQLPRKNGVFRDSHGKECSRCTRYLFWEDFSTNPSHSDKYHNECKQCSRERGKIRTEKDPFWQRSRAYGITEQQYLDMIEAQGGVCAICKRDMKRPQIDHCHTTGKVRGVLCSACNGALGKFQDNPEILKVAIEYLRKC